MNVKDLFKSAIDSVAKAVGQSESAIGDTGQSRDARVEGADAAVTGVGTESTPDNARNAKIKMLEDSIQRGENVPENQAEIAKILGGASPVENQ